MTQHEVDRPRFRCTCGCGLTFYGVHELAKAMGYTELRYRYGTDLDCLVQIRFNGEWIPYIGYRGASAA